MCERNTNGDNTCKKKDQALEEWKIAVKEGSGELSGGGTTKPEVTEVKITTKAVAVTTKKVQNSQSQAATTPKKPHTCSTKWVSKNVEYIL